MKTKSWDCAFSSICIYRKIWYSLWYYQIPVLKKPNLLYQWNIYTLKILNVILDLILHKNESTYINVHIYSFIILYTKNNSTITVITYQNIQYVWSSFTSWTPPQGLRRCLLWKNFGFGHEIPKPKLEPLLNLGRGAGFKLPLVLGCTNSNCTLVVPLFKMRVSTSTGILSPIAQKHFYLMVY